MTVEPVLIAGAWRPAAAGGTFQAVNPATGEPLPDRFPVSTWEDCEQALQAAVAAADLLRRLPPEQIAAFLEGYAARIESKAAEIAAQAHLETALPLKPRLADVELPRTVNQLRQAAAAAREGSWALPTIDTQLNIRSCYLPLGPVCVFGPNNFPLAFGSISGGDFAAAIAAGNPVLAKAHSSHPATTRAFAREALAACLLPPCSFSTASATPTERGWWPIRASARPPTRGAVQRDCGSRQQPTAPASPSTSSFPASIR